jgi:hypothetical protein
MSPRDKQAVSQAIESGQLWRAKEILSGRVGTLPFDAELYEQFGALLLRMGDDVQAGRFLFLSGKRRSEYQPAIDLFLRKHVRAGRGDMFAAFPAHVRRRPWVELPAQVQQELEALKFGPPSEGGAIWAKLRFPKDRSVSPVGCLLAILVVAGFGFLLSLFIVYFFY